MRSQSPDYANDQFTQGIELITAAYKLAANQRSGDYDNIQSALNAKSEECN
jgi:hypothetical protein